MSIRKLYGSDGRFVAERIDSNDRVRLYGSSGAYLGEYIKSMDKTFDSSGYLVGHGDLLSCLIKQGMSRQYIYQHVRDNISVDIFISVTLIL